MIALGALAQMRQRRARHLHDAEQVRPQYVFDRRIVDGFERPGKWAAGIVVDDIERAEALHGERYRAAIVFARCVVAANESSIASDVGRNGATPPHVDVGDDDFRALGGKAQRDGATEAGAGPGDERHLAGKPAHAAPSTRSIGKVSSTSAAIRPRK